MRTPGRRRPLPAGLTGRQFSKLTMALSALNGSRPAPLLPQFQVAPLTLAMKGIL